MLEHDRILWLKVSEAGLTKVGPQDVMSMMKTLRSNPLHLELDSLKAK